MSLGSSLALGAVSGLALGFLFFGALWWTVDGLEGSERPALRMAVSYVLRMALLAVGLLLLARQGAAEVLAALVGLLAARTVLTRRAERARARPAAVREAPWS